MVAWWGAVLGELHATFVDSSPGGGRALSLVALLVAQPLAPLVALLLGRALVVPASLTTAPGAWRVSPSLPVAKPLVALVAQWRRPCTCL